MTPHLIRVASKEELDNVVRYCKGDYEALERSDDAVVLKRVHRSFAQYVGDFFLAFISQGTYDGPDRSILPKAVLEIPSGTEWVAIVVEGSTTAAGLNSN